MSNKNKGGEKELGLGEKQTNSKKKDNLKKGKFFSAKLSNKNRGIAF
jgi:hypothetical protein